MMSAPPLKAGFCSARGDVWAKRTFDRHARIQLNAEVVPVHIASSKALAALKFAVSKPSVNE